MEKTIIKLNASGLKTTVCDYKAHLTMIEGYSGGIPNSKIVYGIAFHKFIDVMFQSKGHLGKAREAAIKSFNVPKSDDKKAMHYSEQDHMLASAYDAWEMHIRKDEEFQTLLLPDGRPATEVTFSIQKYYEDDYIQVDLEGTIDRIGKIKGGIFCINDFKTTGAWDSIGYLKKYSLSQQMRFYVLALKLMGQSEPQSQLGQIGLTNPGYCIDGIFIKPKPCDNVYKRSEVFTVSDLPEFQESLNQQIQDISRLVARTRSGKLPLKTGLMNGGCDGKWGMCNFWHVCKSQSAEVGRILLERDFKKKKYDPLHHNEP